MKKVYYSDSTMNPPLKKQLTEACSILKKGGIVAFPTETVYGIGALYSHLEAQKKIFCIKKRSITKPLMVHIASFDELDLLDVVLPKYSLLLFETFWPGPLALIFSRKEGSTLGIRMPDNLMALRLICEAGQPLMATSANLSGQPSPLTAQDVRSCLSDQVFILDGGKCPYAKSSTILSLTDETKPHLLREGPISKDEIERAIGKKIW